MKIYECSLNRAFYCAKLLNGNTIYASERSDLTSRPDVLRNTLKKTCWGVVKNKLHQSMNKVELV